MRSPGHRDGHLAAPRLGKNPTALRTASLGRPLRRPDRVPIPDRLVSSRGSEPGLERGGGRLGCSVRGGAEPQASGNVDHGREPQPPARGPAKDRRMRWNARPSGRARGSAPGRRYRARRRWMAGPEPPQQVWSRTEVTGTTPGALRLRFLGAPFAFPAS